MQSHNYVPGVSGWKMFGDGTLVIGGRVRAKLNPGTEKAETPYAAVGDQVILSQAFVDAGKFAGMSCMCKGGYTGTPGDKEEKAEVKIDFTGDASKVLDQLLGTISETDLSEGLKNFNLGDFISELKKDVVTRDDAHLTDRIKTLEACVVQLNSEIGRLVVAVSGLVSVSAKK
ncbi:hypothetical protein [Pseudomonas syringae group genomosp. 3]|uniref:hypothetical protein n=1 Tax=Pseudomonas syringae group genomosp. 3 TaxID=251701 RepID=UPI0006B90318|nr:hypothetical protein [Pseudomonas syringae group genomosp. 3]KPB95751.1 Host specificity protein J [Pseudomonas syringae pv. maculicola]